MRREINAEEAVFRIRNRPKSQRIDEQPVPICLTRGYCKLSGVCPRQLTLRQMQGDFIRFRGSLLTMTQGPLGKNDLWLCEALGTGVRLGRGQPCSRNERSGEPE